MFGWKLVRIEWCDGSVFKRRRGQRRGRDVGIVKFGVVVYGL